MATERSLAWRWAWRGFLGIALLAFVVVFVGGVALLFQSRPRSTVLQNGVVLTCVEASYGTNHVAYGGSAAARILHRLAGIVFPRFRQSPPGLTRVTTSEPTLVVWLREEPGLATNRTAPISLTTLLKDDQGVAAGESGWLTLGPLGFGPPGVMHQDFKVLPRRSRTLSLEFSLRGPDGAPVPLGTLELPNPAFTNPPPLIAEPLPLFRTNDGVECRLEALAFGTGSSSRRSTNRDGTETFSELPARPGEEVRATAVVRFRAHETNTTLWTIGSLRTSDGAGNVAKAGSYSSGTVADALAFTFAPVPWPAEPWRLDLWAKRTAAAAFAADELVSLRNIELPPPGRTNQLDHAASPDGIALIVKGFVRRLPVERSGYSSQDISRLLVEVADLPEGAFVDLVRVEDDQGRVLTSDMTSTTHGTPLKIEFGFREVPEDARRVNVTLTVHRGRAFSFVVQPQVVGTNGFAYTFSPSNAR